MVEDDRTGLWEIYGSTGVNERGSGILLHITSLFSEYGIGDLGPSAYQFVDFLSDAKQTYWQILPFHPTSPEYDNSPYHSRSAFAFNTNLISPEGLVQDGFLHETDIAGFPEFPPDIVDFDAVTRFKEQLFFLAYNRFRRNQNDRSGYDLFCRNHSWWLEDYALFTSLHYYYKGRVWSTWPDRVKYRDPSTLDLIRTELKEQIQLEKFLQYLFHTQWQALKNYCIKKGVRLIGDIPIYVNFDSADVWTHPELFRLNDQHNPLVVAGVPPDYFSSLGQLWKNPLYCWEEHEQTGFSWWIQRIEHNLSLVDYARIDHFRGLVAYWEVPADAADAIHGKWVPAPGEKLLTLLKNRFVDLPLIAEDLGIITPDVSNLIERFNLPGMRVLLFAFGESSGSPHAPHNLKKNCILYTSTHDNVSIRGWLESEATTVEKQNLFRYIGREISAETLPFVLIRLAMMSVADTVIIPVQDILSLGAGSRMNRPGTDVNNWRWRLEKDQIRPFVAEKLAEMAEVYERT